MRGLSQKRPFPGIGGLDAQFLCRPFRLVQALIFGVPAESLGLFFGHCVPGLVVLVGFCLVILVLITVGFGTLGGRSVVVASLPGRGSQPRRDY